VSVALQPAAQQIVPADVEEARGWLYFLWDAA